MVTLDRIMTRLALRDRPLAAYGVAALLALAGLLIRMPLAGPEAGVPWVTFFPMVFLACAIGGAGPALLCTVLSALLAGYHLLPPLGAFDIMAKDVWAFVGFLVACLIGCVPIELLHRTVAAHRQALADLQASETRFAQATRAAFGMIYEWDVRTGAVVRSQGTMELLGVPPESIAPTAEAWGEVMHPEDRERTLAEWRRFLPTGRDRIETQYRVRHADGRWVQVWDRSYLERAPDGSPLRVFGASVDVTARVEAEQALRAAVAHRDALVQEVHHRVKNSLQTVSSLLNVQAARIDDPVARRAFSDAIGRIQAVATVHQALYRDGDLTRVHLKHHVEELCRQVAAVNGGGPGSRILCEAEVDDAWVAPDDLVPLALIVNELVTNAFKHGYPQAADGMVRVSFRRLGQPGAVMLRLEVADDGVGLPPGIDPLAGDSLGMKLVQMLVRQLGGILSVEPNTPRGTLTRVTIPIRTPDTASAAAA